MSYHFHQMILYGKVNHIQNLHYLILMSKNAGKILYFLFYMHFLFWKLLCEVESRKILILFYGISYLIGSRTLAGSEGE